MNDKNLTKKVFEELKKQGLYEQEDTIEDEDGENENKSEGSNDQFCEIICKLLHSQTQVHILHLQTTSYSEHKALQGYYEGIDALVDGLVESYQGKHGLLKNYKTFDMVDYKSNDQLIKYFKELLEIISDNRDSVKESYLQNQIDTIEELINSTVYKLKFLK
jgi:DNA-binding ferritin-like protein|tara:strand:- start:144 stop:629 length:486 start_codon:yes stop_codon:yes gene_type:complete